MEGDVRTRLVRDCAASSSGVRSAIEGEATVVAVLVAAGVLPTAGVALVTASSTGPIATKSSGRSGHNHVLSSSKFQASACPKCPTHRPSCVHTRAVQSLLAVARKPLGRSWTSTTGCACA
eukprot:TRINITY_DN9597_c0_g1_i6.p4 TRINITY_DN9597_c0_g1~~TRINITY_DN9597_c0_g1_i6.p4  ORF type:complete len:121 (-),score=7.82 TRINITY_DN9597_c0_g1_i6:2512-2874(-)